MDSEVVRDVSVVYLRVSLGGKEYEPQLTSIPCLEGQIGGYRWSSR